MKARRDDPELAEWLAGQDESQLPRWRPDAAEWDLTQVLLAALVNRFGQVLTLLGDMPTAPGVKRRGKPPAPFPEPVTAIDLARARAREAAHHQIESEVEAAQRRWSAQQQTGG